MTSLTGHFDTIYPFLFKYRGFNSKNETLVLTDGDFVALHYPVPLNPTKTVLIIPGMTSNRNSPVVIEATKKVIKDGYTPAIVELRGCTDFPGKTSKFFNAGSINDLHEVITYLCEKNNNPLAAIVGFSLGANVLAQWAAKNDEAHRHTNYIHCISLPLDLRLTALEANKGFNRVYQRRIIGRYQDSLRPKSDKHTRSLVYRLNSIKKMIDFDEDITVPLNGYLDLNQYYTENSSLQYLRHIKVKCKITNSMNDPLIPYNSLYRHIPKLASNIKLNLLPYGGHLGLLHPSSLLRTRTFFNNIRNILPHQTEMIL